MQPAQPAPVPIRWPYYALAFVFVGVCYYVGWVGKDVLVLPSLTAAFVCVALANLDRFKSFKAGGVEAVLRDAQVAVQESRDLSLLVARMLLSLVKRTGRLGSYTPAQEKEFEQQVARILSPTDAEQREVFKDWDMFVKMDYVFGILGGHTVPQFKADGAVGSPVWKALRRRTGDADFPTPEELTEFLERYGFLTDKHKELIEDYRYYTQHRKHRRPAVWDERKDWESPLGRGNWG